MECAGLSQGTSKLEDLLEIYHLVRAEAMGYEGLKDEKKGRQRSVCVLYMMVTGVVKVVDTCMKIVMDMISRIPTVTCNQRAKSAPFGVKSWKGDR